MRKMLSSLALVFLGLLLLAGPALAQGEAPPALEWRVELAAAIMALTPVLVRLLVFALLLVKEKIPKAWLPVAALVVSWAASYLSGLTAADPILAAAAAFGAIGLREVSDRWVTKPFNLGGKVTISEGDYIVKRMF